MHPPFAWPCCVLSGLCYPRKVLVNNNIPWCEEEDQESDEFVPGKVVMMSSAGH